MAGKVYKGFVLEKTSTSIDPQNPSFTFNAIPPKQQPKENNTIDFLSPKVLGGSVILLGFGYYLYTFT